MFGAVGKTYWHTSSAWMPRQNLRRLHHAVHRQKRPSASCRAWMGGHGSDVDWSSPPESWCAWRVRAPRCGNLRGAAFDTPLGDGTGAGVIFGATGGVMEAALRSAYYLVTGENPDADAFTDGARPGRLGRKPSPISMAPRCASPWRTGWATPPVCSTRFAPAGEL